MSEAAEAGDTHHDESNQLDLSGNHVFFSGFIKKVSYSGAV